MTVEQYIAEFDRLLRYIPWISVSAEVKTRRFEQGLGPHIRRGLASSFGASFSELVDRARFTEIVWRETRDEFRESQKRRGSQFVQGSSSGVRPRPPSVPTFIQEVQSRPPQSVCGVCGLGHSTRVPRGPSQFVGVQRAQSSQSTFRPPVPIGHQSGGRPRAPGRVFALTHQDAEASGTVVSGMITVNFFPACALFDPGATHSFVSATFVLEHGIQSVPPEVDLVISTPIDGVLLIDRICPQCSIRILEREFFADLIILSFRDFDVIFGMDWLSDYFAYVDCRAKRVCFRIPGEYEFCFCGSDKRSSVRLVSASQIQKLVRGGCSSYLAAVVDTSISEQKLENIPVVQDFPDVFPEDLPGLPPDREVEFAVDLAPDTVLISRAPYRLAPAEMKELKDQLQELMDKGFITPSVSPWGAPVLTIMTDST
ncbi:uncharacterized protein LOC143853930 [Tasmannia lanceolata]|uniref:uncharacterized protein LOC143853930 n=1 Tax=Tasmannia lanceolata TaxID=3420 RepID=UPI00406340D2